MPIYLFQHPKTKKVVEVVQRMGDLHTYSEGGVVWDRVFSVPQAAINTRICATDSKDFVNKTRNKNYSIGQLWDMSAELSEKRGGATGKDEIREKVEKDYEKRTGKKHPQRKKPSRLVI